MEFWNFTQLQRTWLVKPNAVDHANAIRLMIHDSECKAKHLETMMNFEQELSRLRHKFQVFCTNEEIRATKASMKRKVSVHGASLRKRAKTFSRSERFQIRVDPSVNSPPTKKQRGRKSMVKLRQQQRDKKRYKTKKTLTLDSSISESMHKIVFTVRSKNTRKRRVLRRAQSPPKKCILKPAQRRKRRILEEDSSSEDEQ